MESTSRRSFGFFFVLMAMICHAEAQTHLNFADFAAAEGFGLQGDARQSGLELRLTSDAPERSGAVWLRERQLAGFGFDTTFQFQLTGAPGAVKGEGFAFVIQNNPLPGLGLNGSGLGYAGIPNSVAIEFDARQNGSTGDPIGPHVSVHTLRAPNSADHAASIACASNNVPDFGDGAVHTGRVQYEGRVLRVFVDDLVTPVLTTELPGLEPGRQGSLAQWLGLEDGLAWVGFAGSTGPEATAEQSLLSWSYSSTPPPIGVAITSPGEGASYLCPGQITVRAELTTTGVVSAVEFFAGPEKIGQADASPWELLWPNVAPGSYELRALARDEWGGKSPSPPVRIVVYPPLPSIGVNFSTGRDGTNYFLDYTDAAGVVEQRVWNNLVSADDGSGFESQLRNGAGTLMPFVVAWQFARTEDQGAIDAQLSPDHKLMKSYLSSNGVVVIQQSTFPVYDLIVYADSANGISDSVTEFRIGRESLFLKDPAGASYCCGYVRGIGTEDEGSATPAGNYVRFSGLTNARIDLVVTAHSGDGVPAAVNAIQIVPSVSSAPPSITRGPYLQSGSPTGMVVRWRTSRATDSRVSYGLSTSNLNLVVDDPGSTTEHIIPLVGITPNTTYFYSVGSTETNMAGGADYYFVTAPTNNKPTRIWISGDTRDLSVNELAVRDAYYAFATNHADVWLNLGDNGGANGTDSQLQATFFEVFAGLARNTPPWMVIGNHETVSEGTVNFPHMRAFSMPTQGEAGGEPSGTIRYFSFDYSNIHFVGLDSTTSDRSVGGPMYQWLERDLTGNRKLWLIAFFHHAPYSKGGHNSDSGSEREMMEMRANFLPLLERYGVDLVVCGHSHDYERSYLIDGAYDVSTSVTETNFKSRFDGRFDGSGAYLKATNLDPGRQGAVYLVAGSSAMTVSPPPALDHPVMFFSTNVLGSTVVDVNENVLTARFLRETGAIDDEFSIVKSLVAQPLKLISIAAWGESMVLKWHSLPGKRYTIERTESLSMIDWETVASDIPASEYQSTWTLPQTEGAPAGFFRVRETTN